MIAGVAATLAALTLSVASVGAGTHAASAHEAVRAQPSLEASILVALNRLRRAHGLHALTLSKPLSRAAAGHSVQMAEDGYFSHDDVAGAPFWKRIEAVYPSQDERYWSVGENLLWSSPGVDASGAIKLWLASPEHRKNMLAPRWREIGISAVHADAAPGAYRHLPVTIVTTDFGVRR